MKLASHKRTKTVLFHLYKVPTVVKLIETENRTVASRVCESGEWGVLYRLSVLQYVLEMDGGDVYRTM